MLIIFGLFLCCVHISIQILHSNKLQAFCHFDERFHIKTIETNQNKTFLRKISTNHEPIDINCTKKSLIPFSELWQIWLASKGQEKIYNTVHLQATSILVDVGGYYGDGANQFIQRANPQVFIFEPNPHYAAHLRLRFKDKNVTVIQNALGKSDEKLYLTIKGDASKLTSLFQSNETTIPVQVRTWNSFDQLFPRIDLLHINCEGCEYSVLNALIVSKLIERTASIFVQFHGIENHILHSERCSIQHLLRRTHEIFYETPFIWEIW